MEQSSTAVKKNNKKLKAAANLKKVSNSLFVTLCSLRGEIMKLFLEMLCSHLEEIGMREAWEY